MYQRTVSCKIIGKTPRQEGLIFKSEHYYVAIKFENGKTTEREMSYGAYCNLKVGSTYNITMYSTDNKRWSFSPEEAEPPSEIGVR